MNDINKSIYNIDNKYGYKLNVNHPEIRKLYERYKKWKGFSINMPLSDEQRHEFEAYILKKIPPLL